MHVQPEHGGSAAEYEASDLPTRQSSACERRPVMGAQQQLGLPKHRGRTGVPPSSGAHLLYSILSKVNARLSLVALLFALCASAIRAAAAPPSPVFFHTQNSDEWVNHSLHIQRHYRRVLVVHASGSPPHRIRVRELNLNSRGNVNGSEHDYRVFTSFKTLQDAADAAEAGDLVAVMPGEYARFVLEEKPSAGDNRYIHFKAMGESGEVIINQPSRIPDWMILLRATHNVIIQGFNIARSEERRV